MNSAPRASAAAEANPTKTLCALGVNVTDEDLLRQFEDLSLPFDQWTHRSHVKVAYLYLQKHSFSDALTQLRARIKAYNAHNNVPDNPTSGYNETTTHAFLHLIAATSLAYGKTHPTQSAESFCEMHPQLMTGHALRSFYSPQRRMHPLAKTQFIEPDLTPLPALSK